MTSETRRRVTALAAATLILLLPSVGLRAATPGEIDAVRVEAESLYEQGRYAEARPLLERLDAEGHATGSLLYRLAYCQRTAGDSDAAQRTQQRALEALEAGLPSATSVEVPFYLVNTYQILGRPADVARVAREATERVEGGQLAEPDSGVGRFQLGKLYADLGAEEPAARWYTRAVEALQGSDLAHGSYVRWASRYLAERAFRLKDFEAAGSWFTTLTDAGEGAAADFERLAVARARVGKFEEAAAAWHQAELLGPANADRSRYSARVATLAAEADPSATAPDGRAWTAWTQPDLETLMKEQADEVKRIIADVGTGESLEKAERKRLREQLKQHKAILVAAALEYCLRGHSIRQASFFGGYAPLLLKKSAWRIPRPPREGKSPDAEPQPGS